MERERERNWREKPKLSKLHWPLLLYFRGQNNKFHKKKSRKQKTKVDFGFEFEFQKDFQVTYVSCTLYCMMDNGQLHDGQWTIINNINKII